MAFTQNPSLSNNPKILCVGRVYVWSSFLSMSVCICLCPFMSVVCIVSVCVHCVMCWSSLHMVANSQVLESATSTIMSGNSSHLGVCTTSLQSQQFQLFAPKLSQELGIDLSKAVQFSRRMKSCKKTFNLWHTIYFILALSRYQPPRCSPFMR